MIVYRFNVLETLKEYGYTPIRLRKEGLLGENAIQSLRKDKMIGIDSLNKICNLLDMQPGAILRHIPDNKPE